MPGVGTAPPGDLVLAWLALARRTALRPGGERQAVASADITWGATLRGGLSESGEYTTLSPEPRLPASESQLAELLGSASLERFHWRTPAFLRVFAGLAGARGRLRCRLPPQVIGRHAPKLKR